MKINRSLLPIKAHYFFFMAGMCTHTILDVYDSNDWLVAVIVCRACVSAESDPHKCATAFSSVYLVSAACYLIKRRRSF